MKEILKPYYDLDEVFESEKFKIINIGELNVTSDQIICCDPLVSLVNGEGEPFIEKVPSGKYPVTLAVLKDENWAIRYMGARLNISNEKAEYYQLALQKNDDISELDRKNREFFGFFVDAGMGCFADIEGAKLTAEFVNKLEKENPDFGNMYDDYFDALLQENYKKYPEYQRSYGDFLNWNIPGTNKNVIIFASGWGDGVYPCYWGYNKDGKICSLTISFIEPSELEEDDNDEDEE